MLWITKIEIDNYRAFPNPDIITIPYGKNLLIYGENGSGKSSIYKSLKDLFDTSYQSMHQLQFPENIFESRSPQNGYVKISVCDSANNPPNHYIYNNPDTISTHHVPVIQLARKIKGFLDYKRLLKVQSLEIPESQLPDLFDFFILDILGDHNIPDPSGGNTSVEVAKTYKNFENALLNNPITSNISIKCQSELLKFHNSLKELIEKTILVTNGFLNDYFESGIQIGYTFDPPNFENKNIGFRAKRYKKFLHYHLFLTPHYNNQFINNYRAIFNEARLSAISICIYLASIKTYPQDASELKVLFLDDVFIGLDSSNRIPILKILNNEFSDYQIFISTYDRHWFELTQRFMKGQSVNKWESIEIYTRSESIGATYFQKPLILPFEENFDKGVYYLNHKTKPDYPAAANYFRKSAEEILKSNIPDHEIRTVDFSLIENHKLGKLINSGKKFLNKINVHNSAKIIVVRDLLQNLENSLPTLLHPLSHYDLSAPIYKGELEIIQNHLFKLKKHLEDLKRMYRVFIPQGSKFTLKFIISITETGYYEISTTETIYLIRDNGGLISLSKGHCYSNTYYISTAGVNGPEMNFPKKNYTSVEDSYEKIYAVISANPLYTHIPKIANCLTEFEFHNINGLHSIENHKTFIAWT